MSKQDDIFADKSYQERREEKQKQHNDRQKMIAKTIGENFATFGLFAVMVLMIGSIWTEFGIFTDWQKFLSEAFITIVLYILADFYASSIGTIGGKLDDDYVKNHNEYLALRETVRKAGIVLMDMFCDWQIDVEYEYYIRRRCRELKLDYKEYMSTYHDKTLEELKNMFPLEEVKEKNFWGKVFGTWRNAKVSSKAAKIFALNQVKHIELTPDILLTDGKVRNERGGVPICGEEYVEEHTVGWKHILVTAFFAIVAAIPVINLIREFSVAMLIYTIFKIALMLYRMYAGYSRGAKAYNAIDPKSLQSKVKYLGLYLEFLDKRIYETLGDRYTLPEIFTNE
ncbi:MAG: hypothetical protein J6L83_05425 [Clostridia bacterium]|nr:hypothetical protein [Clostridia bacterium]